MHFVRRDSSRLFLCRGFAEGEAWASRNVWVDRRYFSMLVNSARFGVAVPSTFYLDTDGSNGDGSIGSPWNSLENARSGIYSLTTSFVTSAVAPTLICTGATDDTTALTNTWPTSSTTYFLTIKVPDADRKLVWDASKYILLRSMVGSSLPIGTNTMHLVGLQISNQQTPSGYQIIDITSLGGELIIDSCLLWGKSVTGATGIYGRPSGGLSGKIVIRNNLIINPQHGILLGNGTGSDGLQSGTEVYVYNNTIWGTGSGGESCNISFTSSGSGRIARVKNQMAYAQASNVSITNADTSDTATNSKGGIETTHFVSAGNPGDWRKVTGDSANKDTGTDLSAVGSGQYQFNYDASLYTRPNGSAWDRGFDEYR